MYSCIALSGSKTHSKKSVL